MGWTVSDPFPDPDGSDPFRDPIQIDDDAAREVVRAALAEAQESMQRGEDRDAWLHAVAWVLGKHEGSVDAVGGYTGIRARFDEIVREAALVLELGRFAYWRKKPRHR